MTKLYTSLILLFAAVTSFGQTCTPDPAFNGSNPGIYPLTPLAPTCDLIAAKTVISLTDTTAPNPFGGDVIVYIDAIRINSANGIPPGLTFETDVMASAGPNAPYGMWLNTGTVPNQVSALGCAFAYGTGGDWDALLGGGPNSDGIYPVEFIVDARIASTDPDFSAVIPNGSWLSDNPGTTGGAFIINQDLQVLPGYDTLNAVLAGEANVAPSTPYTYSVGNDPNVSYNWTVTSGNITAGQGTNEITVEWDGSPTGNVQVELTDGGCYGITDMDVVAVGIGIASSDVDFTVSPNPSAGIFRITSAEQIQSVQITDVSGRVVFNTIGNVTSIDITDKPIGLYLLRIQTTAGFGFSRILKN